jgi:thioredoxin-like negative regulator of GroEL
MEKLEANNATPTPSDGQASQEAAAAISLTEVDDANFPTEVMAYSDTPVLLGFYSPKVPNSNSIAPALIELASQPDPKVKVGIVNIDDAKGLRQRFLVESVPTSILINKGKEFSRWGPEVSVPAVNQALKQAAIKNLPYVDRPR